MSGLSHPRQCKLLGAEVKGEGTVMAVSPQEKYGWAIVLRANGSFKRVWLGALRHMVLKTPIRQQPYLELYDEYCGTEMLTLACSPDKVKYLPPAHRRYLFRRARA